MKDSYLGYEFTPENLKKRIESLEKIPMFEGRPKRDIPIGNEDLLDIKILVNSCSIEQFIEAM